MLGYSQLGLMKVPRQDPVRGYLSEIQKTAERAAHLTQQLLAFSRSQIIEPKVLSLNDLVLELDKMLRRLIGEDVELVILPDPDLGFVKVDPGQMAQVLINLAVNGRDAMPEGCKLIIETANVTVDNTNARRRPRTTAGESVMLAVVDTGTGMTEEVRAHAFEPFFTTKGVGKGTGLGLSTCYGIVSQSGGHISVDSKPGEGTTFKVYLPRVVEPAGALPLGVDSGRLPLGIETVLLVDDEPALRGLASTVLREQGYNVLEAANGHDALRLARRCPQGELDLLLTDVVMPLMGGKELAEQLTELHPNARVLFISGYTGETVAHHGVAGMDTDFMQKPFTVDTLARKVREVLGARTKCRCELSLLRRAPTTPSSLRGRTRALRSVPGSRP